MNDFEFPYWINDDAIIKKYPADILINKKMLENDGINYITLKYDYNIPASIREDIRPLHKIYDITDNGIILIEPYTENKIIINFEWINNYYRMDTNLVLEIPKHKGYESIEHLIRSNGNINDYFYNIKKYFESNKRLNRMAIYNKNSIIPKDFRIDSMRIKKISIILKDNIIDTPDDNNTVDYHEWLNQLGLSIIRGDRYFNKYVNINSIRRIILINNKGNYIIELK